MKENSELMRVGKNLKAVLETIGMSQSELADRCGLTQAAISQIINGHRNATIKSLLAILKVIPCKFEVLLK